MTSPRQAKTRERMVAMLAVGFCLGALATTYLSWRRDALGFNAPRQTESARAPSTGGRAAPPAPADDASPMPGEIVQTAPAIGPADAPAERRSPPDAGGDLEVLRRKGLRTPVDGVAHAALQPSFDQVRGTGRHEAIDILAPRGTPIRAVESGTVAKLFTSARGGLTIYQYDPTGIYCYYYAHLDRYAEGLHEGQQLRVGDVIGYVGTTGNAPKDTPHLHFAIFRMHDARRWWEGTAIDPYAVLR